MSATVDSGVLVALNAKTGETVWSWNMDYYTWSSPAAIYTPEGKAYLVVCDTYGKATMLDGATGKILSSVNLGGLVEASPVVYENTLVVGTRAKKILGLQVS